MLRDFEGHTWWGGVAGQGHVKGLNKTEEVPWSFQNQF